MAELNLKYYENDDLYSDGDVEEDILAFVQTGRELSELSKQELNYHLIYHLSEIRKNILNWYPFKKECNILEIGSGCGAITELLCQKGKKVVSVELSKRRATINYERNKEYENLSIYVGNLNDMDFEMQFDYVIINGVLEYAISFTEGKTPYQTFLRNASRFLNNEGLVLVAIENKLGLKYFAGAPEDHMGQYFAGINGYQQNDSVRTFTKTELSQIFQEADFQYTRFYYPYPDYKFPNEIFTDETISDYGYGKAYFNLNSQRFELFDESYVASMLSQEEVASVFSNSFLVEAGINRPIQDTRVLYAKINGDRNRQFQIQTTVQEQAGRVQVVKQPIFVSGVQHIQNMQKNSQLSISTLVHNVPTKMSGVQITYDYIKRPTLDNLVYDKIKMEELAQAIYILKDFFLKVFEDAKESHYLTKEFCDTFGAKRDEGELRLSSLCISPANIDLICNNVFVMENGQYAVIDCEWVFDFPIPVDYIKWRCINELYTEHAELTKLINMEELLQQFGICESEAQMYREWTLYFILHYVGVGLFERYSIPKTHISLEELQRQHSNELESYLYLDYGTGFVEEQKVKSISTLEKHKFNVRFQIKQNEKAEQILKAFRWDPVENRPCAIKIHQCTINGHTISLHQDNRDLVLENGRDAFLTSDPHYSYCIEAASYSCSQETGSVNACLDIQVLGEITFFEQDEYCMLVTRHQQALYEQQENQQREQQKQLQTTREKLEKEIEDKTQEILRLSEDLGTCQTRNDSFQEEIMTLNEQVQQQELEIYGITHTKGYLMLEKLRKIKNKVLFRK